MTFFMFTTILINDEIIRAKNFMLVKVILVMAISVFINLSIYFIGYAFISFIKSRNHEFRLYLALGMTYRELYAMVLFENILLSIIALILGLFSGTLFSKIFFMAIMKSAKLDNISFSLNIKNYGITFFFFFLLYFLFNIYSFYSIKRLEIVQQDKLVDRCYGGTNIQLVSSILGVLIIGISWTYLYYLKINGMVSIFGTAEGLILDVGIIGLYFFVFGLGSIFKFICKLNKKFYSYNLLVCYRINYRFIKNRNIIFLLSLLGFIIIYYTGFGYTLNDKRDFVSNEVAYDIIYDEPNGLNSEFNYKISQIYRSGDTPLVSEGSVNYISLSAGNMKFDGITPNPKESVYLISGTDFLRFGRFQEKQDNGTVNIIFLNSSGVSKLPLNRMKKVELSFGSNQFSYNINKKMFSPFTVGKGDISSYVIVLKDEDYKKWESFVGSKDIHKLKTLSFKDWQKTGSIVEGLNQVLRPFGETVISKYGLYSIKNGEENFSFFIFSFIEILLFIISACVLYFIMAAEIENIKLNYVKLFRIGITESEIISVIKKELIIVLFFPLMISIIMSYSYVWIITINEVSRNRYLSNTINTICVYFVLYLVFYIITKKKYIKDILNKK